MTSELEHRASLNGGFRGLTVAYIVMGLLVLFSTAIALVGLHNAESGKAICAYIKADYPASHRFRLHVKGFVYDHYLQLKSEARAYRRSAAREPDAVTAVLDRQLADLKDHHAAVALRNWRNIQLPRAPKCS